MKKIIKESLAKINLTIRKKSTVDKLLSELENHKQSSFDLQFLQSIAEHKLINTLKLLNDSKSQIRQDLFVLSELNFKREGYFVEFGATNGIDLNNTYLLETKFNWNGILSEPAKCWHKDLKKNRKCTLDFNCIWKESDETLTFHETDNAVLSTISKYAYSDIHGKSRKISKEYQVKTLSLNELLDKCKAPREIDYLSIDTEGSEYEILKAFDFSKYSFKIITCEHNFTPNRSKIKSLLEKNGYVRKYETISSFDDWYVKEVENNV